MRFLIRALVRTLAVCAVLYGALVGYLYAQQGDLLYPGADGKRRAGTAAQAGLAGFSDLTIETEDGERLAAYFRAPEPGRAAILYLHGNGGSIFGRRNRIRALAAEGRGVLAVSYRGFAGSTGMPSEAGLAADARAAYDRLRGEAPGAPIVLYGESLGTGVAVRLATERKVAGVVLDAPYSSTAEVAGSIYWYVPVGLLMRDQFRAIERVGEVDAPLLVLHGDADHVIPIAFGEKLFAAATEPKTFVRLPGVGHSGVLENGGLAAMKPFLERVEGRAAPTAGRQP